ncbi:MAG: LysM peptidoglycan-binding domain-containing protein [Anaerolineales bacterium]|nr:LysM peptidoglycan-binding domain-containing protein [Anaerolineales bacterium]
MILLLLVLSAPAACKRRIVRPEDLLPRTPEGGEVSPLVTNTPQRSARLREFSGAVEQRADAAAPWEPAIPNATLAVGYQIRTGADGRAFIEFTEGSRLRLGPNTTITFNFLNPFNDSLLTSIALDHGEVFILLTSGALDVETSLGIGSARASYMSVTYDELTQTLSLSCLQGVCTFTDFFVPGGWKYVQTGAARSSPQRMQLADFGFWGMRVPEATQWAFYATEALVQGSATMPIIATETPTLPPVATPTPSSEGPTPTLPPDATLTPTPVPLPTVAILTPRPRPTLDIIGIHRVLAGETLYCLARAYGVEPVAIGQANNLPNDLRLTAGQVLRIPRVQWRNISNGPVCAPQFNSPFPGLPYTPSATPVDTSSTPEATATPVCPANEFFDPVMNLCRPIATEPPPTP